MPIFLTSCSYFIVALPLIERRHAPFETVRTRLGSDHSKVNPDEPDKYFHEAYFASHYDGELYSPHSGFRHLLIIPRPFQDGLQIKSWATMTGEMV